MIAAKSPRLTAQQVLTIYSPPQTTGVLGTIISKPSRENKVSPRRLGYVG